MILEIADLGAIKKMKLDLSKNFILFCGPNSTGKTYASYILNAFLSDGSIIRQNYFDDIIKEIKEKGEFNLSKNYIDDCLLNTCQEIKKQAGNLFGISEETKNTLFDKFEVNISYDNLDYKKSIEEDVNITLYDNVNVIQVTKSSNSNIVKIESIKGTFQNILQNADIRMSSIINTILTKIALRGRTTSRMLTVERNSIYTFKTELSLSRNALIDRIQQNILESGKDIINIVNSSSRRYPYAVRESLRVANDLENIQKVEGEYAYIADEIEHDLLKGKVSTTKNGDVEFSTLFSVDSKKLPFHLSSSIVKTMASLVIYLRHIARQGDTLIVDEPEMNFHPDVQILLAQIFAKLSNEGIHVVISTHSDYIIREINNMIMAGALYSKGREKEALTCGYDKDTQLDKNSVEVIYFNPNSKTGVVETQSLEIKDEGFEVTSIDDAIIKQNQRTDDLYDYLNE